MDKTRRCNRCGSELQPEEKAVCEACIEQGKELLEQVRESEDEFKAKRQDNRILDEEDD